MSNQPSEQRLLLTYKQADDSPTNDMDSNSGDNIMELEEVEEAAKITNVGDLLVGFHSPYCKVYIFGTELITTL